MKIRAVDDIIEYVLIHYRWVFVCFFLLPISVFYDVWHYFRNYLIFRLQSAPKLHSEKVKRVQRQVKEWIASGRKVQMCTARPGWQTMSFRQPKYKKTLYNVNVNLVDILEIDADKGTILLEPLVTMGQLTATIAPLGWTLPIVPEIDDLTVGGMVMGTGIESSSHRYGLFQHICVSYELVLADGSVVKCSKDNNPDLFYSVPWSYGSLGFLTAVEMKIIPACQFIRLEYKAVHNVDVAIETFKKQINTDSEFVEGIMFNLDQGVIMTGKMTDFVEPCKVNEIGKWYKPWFYKHVKRYLGKGHGVEYIPIRDYYHRHTRSIFWELKDIIPFGNNVFFRYLFGWAVPPKVSLLKLTQTEAIKKLYENNHIIQDMLVPIGHMKETLQIFDQAVKVYPVWLCPFKLTNDPGLVHCSEPEEMYVDIGVYGVPQCSDFNPVKTTRKLEEDVRRMKGFQMLYADTYMSEDEFRSMFDHSLYDKMRVQYQCESAFPSVYGKINKTVRS